MKNTHILIFGDSIVWGAWDKEGGWAQRIKSFVDHDAVRADKHNYAAVYCLGVDGNNTLDLLERFDIEIEARQDEGEDTLVIVAIGVNDSQFLLKEKKNRVPLNQYKANLVELINKAKQHGASIVFIGLTPVDKRVDPTPWNLDKAYKLRFIQDYEDILKKTCKEGNIPFIEVLSKFMENNYKNLLIDGLHPTTKGHKIIFEEVLKYLTKKRII